MTRVRDVLIVVTAWREMRRTSWHRHARPHLDGDGVCLCTCPGCVLRAPATEAAICICSRCDARKCGQHVGVPRAKPWPE